MNRHHLAPVLVPVLLAATLCITGDAGATGINPAYNYNCGSPYTPCITADNSYSDGVGVASTTTNGSAAIQGFDTAGGNGVQGQSDTAFGVIGISAGGTSFTSDAYGVVGETGSTGSDGVHGLTASGAAGTAGINTSTGTCSLTAGSPACSGLWGQSTKGYGVYGKSSDADAIHGYNGSNNYAGVAGDNEYTGTCNGPGSTSCNGVWGESHGGIGVYGQSSGSTSSAIGVYGTGVQGIYGNGSGTGAIGVYGQCSGSGCYAGWFEQSVNLGYGASYYYDSSTCVGGYCAVSDRRLKKNIEPLVGAIDKLLQINGVTFEWKDPEEHQNRTGRQFGVIAQDVEKVFPHWVSEGGPDGIKVVNPDAREVLGVTVEAIRTLKMENDDLRQRVKSLETGRRIVAGFDLNGIGFAVGGLALAGAMVITRRKRTDEPRSSPC